VAAVTYLEVNGEVVTGVAVADATFGPVGGATAFGASTVAAAAGGGVPTVYGGRTDEFWSLSTAAHPVATAVRPPPAATRTDVSAAARDPTSTQGKPTCADAAAGIPDAAHTSTQDQSAITSFAAVPASNTDTAVATTTKTGIATATTAALSIHSNEDDEWYWDLAPLGPRTLGNAAATREYGHHVDHCRLQDFDLLSSDSESEDKFNVSYFVDCDGF
jgi:hypothetical protein